MKIILGKEENSIVPECYIQRNYYNANDNSLL